MKYLLDTDHLSVLQHPSSADALILTSRMDLHSPDDFVVSIVSFHEQIIGCHAYINRAKREAELIRGYSLLQEVIIGFAGATVLPFDSAAIAAFDALSGLGMATMDRRIAATALSRGLTLLTRNRSDFASVPGLIVEDWTV